LVGAMVGSIDGAGDGAKGNVQSLNPAPLPEASEDHVMRSPIPTKSPEGPELSPDPANSSRDRFSEGPTKSWSQHCWTSKVSRANRKPSTVAVSEQLASFGYPAGSPKFGLITQFSTTVQDPEITVNFGAIVGDGLGTGVGTGVGDAVGTRVGAGLGAGMGTGVGVGVGRMVGCAVGKGVGIGLGN
jgi:hypothetical protein